MIKKTIAYTDFNGVQRAEDVYFNLTKAELMDMELTTEGGMAERLQRIIDANNGVEIYKTFKSFVRLAYGVKSADGRRFQKKDPVTGRLLFDEFEETEPYNVFFTEILTDTQKAIDFVNALIPEDLMKQVQEAQAAGKIPSMPAIASTN